MNRMVTVSLILMMLMYLLLSCAENTADSNFGSDTTVITAEETTVPELTHDLPITNMDGKTFTFLTCNWPGEAVWTMNEIVITEMNGNAVNDAQYIRNGNVQELYNCVVAEHNINAPNDALNKLRSSVNAGDNAFDIFLPRMQAYSTLITDGLIIDLNKLPYLDFIMPWWDTGSVNGLSMGGRQFGINSYMTTNDKGATSTLVFNKKIISDYNIESPYDFVSNSAWTLDTFGTIIKNVSADLDGNGEMNENDLFGFLYQRDTLLDCLVAGGESIAKKDSDDIPYISINSESAISKAQKIFDVLYDTNTCFNVMFLKGDFNVGMDAMFQGDQGLFMWIRMINIVSLRTMEADFGIIPIPKFDETQTEYYNTVNPWTGIFMCVPISNTDSENTGIFLEAMAYEGLKNVKTAYYDTLLNGIITRDEESSVMLDIIFANRRYDIGAICTFGGLQDIVYMPMTYDRDIASYVEKRMSAAEKAVEKVVSAMNEKY
ncbi:MAG: hypothetical protein ACYCWE_22260 [Eubacteriales bacterium]